MANNRSFLVSVFLILVSSVGFAGTQQVTQELAVQRSQKITATYLASLRQSLELPADSEFRSPETGSVSGRFCNRHTQAYRGRVILGSLVLLCFDHRGELEDSGTRLWDGASLLRSTSADVVETDLQVTAEQELRAKLGGKFGKVVKAEVESVWVEDTESQSLRAASSVHFVTKAPYNRVTAIMDHQTGRLLSYAEKVIHATGRGQVFPRDVFNTPKLETVPLNGLLQASRLQSAFFTIFNEDGAGASNEDGEYIYPISSTHFDEVQVYYAMQVAMEKFVGMGYEPFGSIPIVVHFDENYANAFYDGTMIAIGDGDGQVLLDLARDNTVVTHEYGHAMIDNLAHVQIMSGYGDGGAIHEGIADYLACSVYENPILGQGAMPAGEVMRRCDTDLPYSTINEEVHDAGQVISGALWELRAELKEALGDQVLLQALNRVQHTGKYGSTRAADIYKAVLAGDKALTGGSNRATIKRIFERRGFSLKAEPKGDDLFAAGEF